MFKKGFYGGKFFPFHRGHLYCCMTALSQCEELYVIMMYNSDEELRAMQQPLKFDKKLLTPEIRELVIRRELQPFPNIHVLTLDCAKTTALAKKNGTSTWAEEAKVIHSMIGDFDACFSGEASYGKIFKELYPDTQPVLIDRKQSTYHISGTMIRDMTVAEAYDNLPRTYQDMCNRSVLVIGTESCGKTTLVKKLAKLFNTSYTDEYGRAVCEEYNTGQPAFVLYDNFIYGQKMAEQRARNMANKVYFCDTDAIYTKFFAKEYENHDMPLADAVAAASKYDLVIYLEPTNTWVNDGFRTFGDADVRRGKNAILKKMYEDAGYNMKVLSGTYEENYRDAINLVSQLLKGNN